MVDGPVSMVRAGATRKKDPKDELRSLPDLYFGPFIVSFQLWFLPKLGPLSGESPLRGWSHSSYARSVYFMVMN